MICPHCHKDNTEFVEVENPEYWCQNLESNIIPVGTAVECLSCGLRGPGSFEGNDDDDTQAAMELWNSLVMVNENSRRKITEMFILTPIVDSTLVNFVLDLLFKVKDTKND